MIRRRRIVNGRGRGGGRNFRGCPFRHRRRSMRSGGKGRNRRNLRRLRREAGRRRGLPPRDSPGGRGERGNRMLRMRSCPLKMSSNKTTLMKKMNMRMMVVMRKFKRKGKRRRNTKTETDKDQALWHQETKRAKNKRKRNVSNVNVGKENRTWWRTKKDKPRNNKNNNQILSVTAKYPKRANPKNPNLRKRRIRKLNKMMTRST